MSAQESAHQNQPVSFTGRDDWFLVVKFFDVAQRKKDNIKLHTQCVVLCRPVVFAETSNYVAPNRPTLNLSQIFA